MAYDGRTRRILKIPLTYTRALAPGPGGDLSVGDADKLGGVPRPGSGDPEFRSLLERVPGNAQRFGQVRKTGENDNGVGSAQLTADLAALGAFAYTAPPRATPPCPPASPPATTPRA